ncbi:hypothetical protein VKT23_010165 [Stygiomarasmius scandens]|uniref:Uncharacterized protein n=1 Tax=Marasmiellus scandens TaxID=2682957 RepID=A0ABR1JGY8_9AGAR
MRTSSVLLLSGFISLSVYAQDALTIIPFGGDQSTDQNAAQLANFLYSDLGLVSVSPEVVPIGTADGGSETTYRYQEVDVVTDVVSGTSTTATVTATGNLIASASGFRISFTAAPPTTSAAGFMIEEECAFNGDSSGGCSFNAAKIDGDATVTSVAVQVTGTGMPVKILVDSVSSQSDSTSNQPSDSGSSTDSSSTSDSSGSPSSTDTPSGSDTQSSSDNSNAAISSSVSGISMISTITVGILLRVSKVL